MFGQEINGKKQKNGKARYDGLEVDLYNTIDIVFGQIIYVRTYRLRHTTNPILFPKIYFSHLRS